MRLGSQPLKACPSRSRRSSKRLTKPLRLDAELVRRGLVASRSEAGRAIQEGKVVVRGIPVTRAATLVPPEASIAIAAPAQPFVSRGGEKLEGALRSFAVEVAARRWLDAGASTGGFTDCLLQRGAAEVATVDVGYGQLDWRLRNDPRVTVIERTNVRTLAPEELPWRADGVVADLSFISLTLVLDALVNAAAEDADQILLVKPQFEVGRKAVGKGGVVRDPASWRAAIERVIHAATGIGLALADVALAHPSGPAGNREFFVHLRRGIDPRLDTIDRALEEASDEA